MVGLSTDFKSVFVNNSLTPKSTANTVIGLYSKFNPCTFLPSIIFSSGVILYSKRK